MHSAASAEAIADYRRWVLAELPTHEGLLQAQLLIATELARALNNQVVECLRPKANGRQAKFGNYTSSHKWAQAEAARFAAIRMVAATIEWLDAPPPGTPLVEYAIELVNVVTGPLCNGWTNNDTLTHHPDGTCPVHTQ